MVTLIIFIGKYNVITEDSKWDGLSKDNLSAPPPDD